MTDKDIVKALECCGIKNDCKGCYFNTHESGDICVREIVKNAFNLINRQQAEIERLKSSVDDYLWDFYLISGCEGTSNNCWKTCPDSRYNKIKSEAIREFAERLKENITDCHTVSDGEYVGYDWTDITHCIDNVIKEMEEV